MSGNRRLRRRGLSGPDASGPYENVYRAAKHGTGRRRLFARIITGLWVFMAVLFLAFVVYGAMTSSEY